ncbi:hypothetical protein [Alistipes sp.]|uniref:hypothetical protein n=1 Tax=Alistipes sp. TaxID=1872444 RepID=UPI003AF1254F
MKPWIRYALLALMWSAVAAYVAYAAATAHARRGERKVRALEIEVVDSTSQGHLVSTGSVRGWIARSDIQTVGERVDAVDLTALEQLIARNGFVDRVAAYVTYRGVLRIEISQRKPLLRLLTDGVNSYVTREGFVFSAPRASSLYVPVVTGSYRPPFPADHTGDAREYIDGELRRIDGRIAQLEHEKYPFYKRELKNDRNLSALRRMRVKRRWWRLESAREFETRVEELRRYKAQKRRDYRYEARMVQQGIDRIAAEQEAERRKQKKLEKTYEDFMNLLTFVEKVEEDDFWRSEVVQIVARTVPSGALEVDLIPRSGRHTIRFGRLENAEEKFEKLMRFYRRGLSRIGWDEYRTIDIRYDDQVVCSK